MKKQQLLYRLPILFFIIILFFSCKNENRDSKAYPENNLRIDSLNQLASNVSNDSVKLNNAKKALSEATQNNYQRGKSKAFNIIGFVEINKGDFANAKMNFDSSLFYGNQLKDSLSICESLQGLGELYLDNGLPDSSLHFFLEAELILKTFEAQQGFFEEKATLFKHLGNLNLSLAQYSDTMSDSISLAIAYAQKALNYFEKANSDRGITRVYLDMGKFYYDADSIDQATENYQIALERSITNKDTLGIAQSQIGLGGINLDLENYDAAEDNFRKANAGFKIKKIVPEIFDTDYNLCQVWLEKGLVRKALNHADSLIRPVFSFEKRFVDKEYAAYLFAEIYKKSISENRLPDLTDSIIKYKDLELAYSSEGLDEIKAKEIAITETLYDVKLKDLELSKKETEVQYNAAQRNWAVLAFFLLMGIFVFYFLRKKAKEKLLVQEMETQKLEIETQKLKLEDQIQKAEVGAANSVISALEEERKKIARMIHDKLGSTLVTVNRGLKSYFKDSEKVSIEKIMLESYTSNLDEVYNDLRDISHLLDEQGDLSLIEKLEKFCSLFSNSGKMKIQFLREGDFSNLEEMMRNKLFLFAKELITNVLKYSDAPKVEIQLIRFEKMISLSVIDDGKGFELETTPLGFGLSKMKSDVESMNGSFLLDSKLGFGTTVMIDIPK